MRGEINHSYRFKSFRLDVEDRRLFRGDVPVQLEPKVFDLLALLVENRGHLVEKDELLRNVWADSFVEEANIARIVYILRKTLGEDGIGNKFIETVPKKGYRFVAEVEDVSEPPATSQTNGNGNFSVSAESLSTPEFAGQTDENSSQIPSANDQTAIPSAAKLNRIPRIVFFSAGFLCAIFLIAFLIIEIDVKSVADLPRYKVKSIAVLPVKPINAETRDELYEIGIADSLIHQLSATKNLIVRPLSATRRYTDLAQDPLAAGHAEKTDYVLASNYQLVDGRIRITAQLINVATGQIEETYKSEKDASRIFAAQDAIANEVGNILFTRFAVVPDKAMASRGTTNEEAYRLYLQGKNLTMRRSTADHQKAIEYFEQAVRLDPNFASAYARMAHAYLWSGLDDNAARAEKAKEIVKKALELDNSLAEAYVTRAELELVYEWDFPAVERDLATTIELEPNNDTAHWLYGLLLSYRGRFDEALREIDTARAINPGAVMYMRDRGRILYYARRYDEAIAELKLAVDLDENMNSGWLRLAYSAKGDEIMSYEIFIRNQKRSNPDLVETYQEAYETGGWTEVKRKFLEIAKTDENRNEQSFYALATLCANLGEKELAFEYLNKAFERREWRMVMLKVDPILDALRDDPRFDEIVARVGIK